MDLIAATSNAWPYTVCFLGACCVVIAFFWALNK